MESLRQLLTRLSSSADDRLTEDEITSLWTGIVPCLDDVSALGETTVSVTEPGRSGFPEGPDVWDVVLDIDGITRKGDVEIHRQAADWYHHGHHRDSNFNEVVLHVCLTASEDCPTRRCDDTFVPVVQLRGVLEGWESFVDEQTSNTLRRRMSATKRPCYSSQPDVPYYRSRLNEAAKSWLCYRAGRVRKGRVGEGLLGFLIESLGFTYNHDEFLRLAERIPNQQYYQYVNQLESRRLLEAWWLGVGGWLQRPFSGGVNRIFYNRRKLWEDHCSRKVLVSGDQWNRSNVRPHTFPVRRWIMFGWMTRSLEGTWQELLGYKQLEKIRPESIRTFVLDRILDRVEWPGGSYWQYHYTMSDDRHNSVPKPLGKSWCDQFVINQWIPWLYMNGLRGGNRTFVRYLENQFLDYPPVLQNRRTRRVRHQWGHTGEYQWESAGRQQAAVFLYKKRCRDGKCQSCPFNRRKDKDQIDMFPQGRQ
ncbi:MAG: DUF2851 family protein [bacterium]